MTTKITWAWSGKETTKERVVQYVGPGWSKLVSTLIDDLFELGWDGILIQVKEKFGMLRFYIGQGNDQIRNRITQAESMSGEICEECGEPGKLYYDGWIRCLCPLHAKEHGRVE